MTSTEASLPRAASQPKSRLMVKGLPKHLTLERFREHFAAKGEVTDARLARTSDGQSRCFGFIGFKTEKEAKAALKHFNSTYIDTSKIEVVVAKAINDPSLPRPWSRHTHGSSAFDRKVNAQKAEEERLREKEERIRLQREAAEAERQKKHKLLTALYADDADAKLKEYLDVMRPRSSARQRTWANDDVLPIIDSKAKNVGLPVKEASSGSVKARVETVANKKTGGDGMLLTKVHVKFDGDDEEDYQDLPSKAIEMQEGSNSNGDSVDTDEIDADQRVTDLNVSDMDYFKSRMTAGLDDEDALADTTKEDMVVDDNGEIGLNTGTIESKTTDEVKELSKEDEGFKPLEWDPEKLKQAVPDRARLKGDIGGDIPPADIIADTGRLFVKNLPFTCTPEDIQKLFGKFGPLAEVHISIDKETKKSKGYAFVLFLLPEHAVKAYTALDGHIFQGRILEVVPGKEKPQPAEADASDAKTSYKKQRDAKKKSEATNETGWNSLFLNSDAVAEAMASKLNVSKSDILDPSSENMAVRLALAETNIIAETKAFLEEEGINLDAFTRRKERSNTIILVKNIPFKTTSEEITSLFSSFGGSLGRVVLPPHGTIAIVEFLEQNEAKSAFRRLAFTKFKHLPLYLEWAPVDSFKKAFDKAEYESRLQNRVAPKVVSGELDSDGEETNNAEASKKPDVMDLESKVSAATAMSAKKLLDKNLKSVVRETVTKDLLEAGSHGENSAGADEDAEDMPVATLFVKNLNFETTETGLRKVFDGIGGVRSVRISTKPDKKNPGAKLSMGFGFVEFVSKEHAMRAAKSVQGFKLDGHELQLKFSNATVKGQHQSNKRTAAVEEDIKVTGTKLIVRNIPFEATKKDIRQLFSSFGQVKSVRLPQKFNGAHRGFCFVDFLTKQEAISAFKSLGSTHLYGRHLVIEWAEDESSVEAIRAKTAKAYFDQDHGVPASKRRRVDLNAGEATTSQFDDS